ALAVSFLALLVFCYLAPAIKDGPSFSPTGIAQGVSYLTRLAGAAPNHNIVNGDQITQGIPWEFVDWRAAHAGELPLWNSYSGTGLPQLLNFESGALALPTLVSYLFPLSLAFLVTIGIKLLLAGTGAYVCCRLLGCRPVAAALGGTTAMLSGAFAGWLGWSVTGPYALAGWVLAGSIWAYRSERRVREVALLAFAVAFAIYGGFPESYLMIAGALLVFYAVSGIVHLARRQAVSWRGLLRVTLGVVAGLALSAPLWLPGLSVIRASARNGKTADFGLPLHSAAALFTQGFFGLPIQGSYWFGPSNYFETAAYLGVVAIVLVGLVVGAALARPAVAGLAVAGLACLAVAYRVGSGPVQKLVSDIGLGSVAVQRALSLVGLLAALLAALGAELLMERWRERRVQLTLLGAEVLVALVLAELWRKVSTASMPPADAHVYPPSAQPTTAVLHSLRRDSLLWPTAIIAVLLIVTLAAIVLGPKMPLQRVRQVGSLAGLALLGLQAGFLLFAGVGINSYASTSFPETASLAKVQAIVGNKLLALDSANESCAPPAQPPPNCGVRYWLDTGVYPETNLGYQLDELAMHDPTIPQSYFQAWPVPNADQTFAGNLNIFAPAVNSAALARRYGASYVLAGPGRPAPTGTVEVAAIPSSDGVPGNSMVLYRVPGAARFSFATGASGDRVLSATHPGDASYDLKVKVAHTAKLQLRITDSPGWQVSADGRSLPVRRYEGAFLQVTVPAGTTSVTMHYWPRRLTEGIVLAVVALAALIGSAAALGFRRRRSPGDGPGERPSEATPLVASMDG
ncbi:MAG: putative rane protein, partial [Acidimicrobiaceae bacterium]|nr:putative rane protein [Acidimicrobiaceae bacterium]